MRWRIVPLMMAFIALAHFNRVCISVAGTEEIIPSGLIDKEQMGKVYSAYLLLYTLFMMPGGWFIDRFGPRIAWSVMAAGSVGFIALTGVAGLLCTTGMMLWVSLLVIRGCLGIASAPLHPTAARLVANWIPPAGANLANGLVTSAACIGIASTYLVFGLLIDEVGWERAFLVCAGVTLVLGLAWTLLASDRPPEAQTLPQARRTSVPPLETFVRFLLYPSMPLLTVSYGLVSYFQYLFFYWAEYYFENVQELSRETSRLYSTILVLAMGLGMVVGGGLTDVARWRLGTRRGLAFVPLVALFFSAGVLVLALMAETSFGVLVCLTLAMGAVGMSEGSYWTAATRIGGHHGGSAAAVLNTGGNAGGLLAPALTPIISDQYGWHATLAVAGGVCVLAAIPWVLIDPEERKV